MNETINQQCLQKDQSDLGAKKVWSFTPQQ